MRVPQTSNVLVLEIAGAKSSCSEIMVMLLDGGSFKVGTIDFMDYRLSRFLSIWTSAVSMEAGRKLVMFAMLRPVQVRKLLFLIA